METVTSHPCPSCKLTLTTEPDLCKFCQRITLDAERRQSGWERTEAHKALVSAENRLEMAGLYDVAVAVRAIRLRTFAQ